MEMCRCGWNMWMCGDVYMSRCGDVDVEMWSCGDVDVEMCRCGDV